MKKSPDLLCWRLDGTTGSQCENLRYGHRVPKPSLAQESLGEKQTRQGVRNGKYFLFCKPGLACRSLAISFEEMIKQQKKCDRYIARP